MGKPQPSAPPPPYDIYPTTRRRPAPWREPEKLGWVDRHPHWATLLIAATVTAITAAVLLWS